MVCQVNANTSESTLAIGKQVACGTLQTTLKYLRTTGHQLEFSAQTVQSQEITTNRGVSDLIRTRGDVGGPVSGEMSYSSDWLLIQAALQSPTAIDGAGTLVKNGSTKAYFTVEKNTPAGGTNYFTSFPDMQVNSWTVNLPTAGPITSEFNFIGLAEPVTSGTSIGTTSAATTTKVYNSNYHVNSITIDGDATYKVQSIGWTVTNNQNGEPSIGDVVPSAVTNGQLQVTGPISIVFKSNALYQKFLDDEELPIAIVLDDKTGVTNGNQTLITFPRVKFSNLSQPIQGNNQTLLVTGTFQALQDSVTSATVIVSGVVAV